MHKMSFVTTGVRYGARLGQGVQVSGLDGKVVAKSHRSSAAVVTELKAVSGVSILGTHDGVLPDDIFDILQQDDD